MTKDKKPFTSDGCTLFPDLWFRHCCKDHDYAYWAGHDIFNSDINLLCCIAKSSKFLGPLAFALSGIIVSGMAIGRPVYRLYQKISGAFFFTKK